MVWSPSELGYLHFTVASKNIFIILINLKVNQISNELTQPIFLLDANFSTSLNKQTNNPTNKQPHKQTNLHLNIYLNILSVKTFASRRASFNFSIFATAFDMNFKINKAFKRRLICRSCFCKPKDMFDWPPIL